MSIEINDHDWVWVVVILGAPGEDQFLGQELEDDGISFIPTFTEKDDALKCYNLLVLADDKKYEVQAVIFEDLKREAATGGFEIFILGPKGEIRDRVVP